MPTARCLLPAAYCLLLTTAQDDCCQLFNANVFLRFMSSDADLSRQRSGDLLEGFAVNRRVVERHGRAGIALLPNRQVERNFSQEREVELLGGFARAAVAEDFLAVAALRAQVVAHVFHDA